MLMYTEQGESLMDCELKIAEKYKRPFHIMSRKDIRIGGFLGFGSKPGVQVEFYFTQPHFRSHTQQNHPGMHHSLNTKDPSHELEENKEKVLAAAKKNLENVSANGRDSAQAILDSLKEIIENGNKKEEHPSFAGARELLRLNDFSQSYTDKMLERLRKEITLDQLDDFDLVQDRLLEWIGESISIYREEERPRKPRIMVLVGPTGVGKTTTVSKLAAIYGIGTDTVPAVDVRIISIDDFRIGAKEQIEQTGYIMRIPVVFAVNKGELRKEIAVNGDNTDLFLVDTIGKSPRDLMQLGEMKEILDGLGRNAEYHLVISASTKTSDIENILRHFEPFDYKSVILTKMDETGRTGNIISALAEKRKPLSYITDGQEVPVDIRRASVVRFLINLDGFKVNRQKIEERFPSSEAEQFKWR